MNFFKSELEMIYQYAAPTRAGTLDAMKEALPAINDDLTRAIMENAVCKLQKIPEPECSRFIADTRAVFLKEQDSSIRCQLTAAKAGQSVLLGHDLLGEERFMPETRHMITLDVLNNDSPVGYKGERYRFFLSDEGYQNARRSEQRGEIAIKSHAAVSGRKLYPDRKLTGREPER
ncbi:DUF5720 family protein [Enterocloster lavalensis]|uniref:DUF5720 family protein n=1 Tax=Enterocloster lavalensis TaxID=460384 RepID=UPI0023F2EFB7|nr:DUF5720 family protein [Enterocloster lavalensis]